MRKYIIGAIIGSALTCSITAYADDIQSIVGKTVQSEVPVKLDNQKLQANAAIVDGTSYLPVRAVSESLGLNVSYDAKTGISLTKKDDVTVSESPAPTNSSLETPTPSSTPTNEKSTSSIIEKRPLKILVKLSKQSEKTNIDYEYLEADGNQYISASALNGDFDISISNNVATFKKEGYSDVTISISNDYQVGIDSFKRDGLTVFKLSLFGLKAEVQGDTLVIDKK